MIWLSLSCTLCSEVAGISSFLDGWMNALIVPQADPAYHVLPQLI